MYGPLRGDQVSVPCEFRQRGTQPARGKYRVGVDIGYELAFGNKTPCPTSLNKSPLGLVEDLDIGD